MAKILVQVPQDVGPLQVEFPEHKLDERGRPLMERPLDDKGKPAKDGKGKPAPLQPVPFGERSRDGALHLRPGASKVITEAEFQHIKRVHPDVGRRLRVVKRFADEPAKAAEPAPEAPPAPAPSANSDASADSEDAKSKKPKGK